ncbi:helix-turn-helix domain-containing protein [Vibrio algivorus]|uniref:Helix-turn-helix domain-containing protein n=1 Tax=Vibrio algivorus TaxID=1667024 RepID=A0A557P6C3_9VIBR|nr:helix-turn-helix domain-containing protein [Vibrio algivorus]TVO36203.1 helix-turn-helix domain-containing protein [Vibrio algivorus]
MNMNDRINIVKKVQGVTPIQKSLLVFLAFYASEQNHYTCWPSQKTLAQDISTSPNVIRSALKELERQNLISIKRERDGSNRNKPNRYTVELIEIIRKTSEVGNEDTYTVDNLASDNCVIKTEVGNEITHGGERGYPQVGNEVTPNKNITRKEQETGVENTSYLSTTPDYSLEDSLFPEQLKSFYEIIKKHSIKGYGKKLPVVPFGRDVKAMECAIELFDVHDELSQKALCEFSEKELGPPNKVWNPIVRLIMAYEGFDNQNGIGFAENRFKRDFELFYEAFTS